MATLFEAWLAGEDHEHLEATGRAALDEVARVEAMLSRFDPTAEVARVNREAASRPVRVDVELFAILGDCLAWCERTGGYFDVSVPGRERGVRVGDLPESIRLDAEDRTVRFRDEGVRLDFGGYGKGYALDRAARILEAHGVENALVHGGTSSVLARGRATGGTPWRVGLRDPAGAQEGRPAAHAELRDCALSYSAALDGTSAPSDIVDPHTGAALERQAACAVVAPSAVAAEVWSTALLAMGRERALGALDPGRLPGCSVAWLGAVREGEVVEWLHRSPVTE